MRILEFVIQGASGAPMLPEPTLRTEVSSVGLPPAIDVQKDILGRAVLYAGKNCRPAELLVRPEDGTICGSIRLWKVAKTGRDV